ncbi:hypothetical protein GCM10028772_03360 [Nocardioides ultimimeridianus]
MVNALAGALELAGRADDADLTTARPVADRAVLVEVLVIARWADVCA